MKRKPFACVLIAAGALAVLPAVAAGHLSPTNAQIYRDTSGECNSGLTSGIRTSSYATISATDTTVTAVVNLVDLAPNKRYQVDLVQVPSGQNCVMFPGETSVVTNSSGQGSVTITDPIAAGTTGAFVMLLNLDEANIFASTTVPFSAGGGAAPEIAGGW